MVYETFEIENRISGASISFNCSLRQGYCILLHKFCLFVKPVLNLQAMTDSTDTRVSLILAGVPEQVNIPIKYEKPLIIAPPFTMPLFVSTSFTPIGRVNHGPHNAS